MLRRIHILVCALSGALLALAFPRANLYPLAWIAIAPLMYYIYRLKWGQALLCGFVFGVAFFASLLYWIGVFGILPLVLLAIIQSVYVMGFVALAKGLGSRLGSWGRMMLLPALWVSVEWLSNLWITAFPWGNVAYSQYKLLPIVQISSITGVWGVSWLIAFANAVLANYFDEHRGSVVEFQAAGAAILILGVSLYGSIAIHEFHPDGRQVRIGIAQGNINQNVPHDAEYIQRVLVTYRALTRDAAGHGAKLIIWPEGVAPGNVKRDPVLLKEISDLAAESPGTRLLVGGRDEDDVGHIFNCAFLIGPNGLLGEYAKVHLVPFGEFVLLRDYIPFLERYRVTSYDFSPGKGFNVMDGIGAVVCFESIFPQIAREMANSGAEVLVVITNDAWYRRTAASEQHISKSVFRAVENRRYVIQGATTGISGVIDPCGRMIGQTGLYEERTLVRDVSFISRKSFYTRHGDWFFYLMIVVSIILGASSLRARGGDRRPRSSRR